VPSGAVVLARHVVQGFSTGVSVLVSSAHPLGGRNRRHECSSSLLQNATRWLRRNFEVLGRLPARRAITPRSAGGRVEVVWCSRTVHPRAGGRLLLPHRMMAREAQFVLALRRALGPDVRLRVVDFGRLNGPESIAAIEDAQVLIGFHGAGMTCGMFMQPSDAAFIEIFGDDRGSDNRHYATIAKLMDFNYAHVTMRIASVEEFTWWHVEGEQRSQLWDGTVVDQIAYQFHTLPWSVPLRKHCAAFANDKMDFVSNQQRW
jgi:hypothetical protein